MYKLSIFVYKNIAPKGVLLWLCAVCCFVSLNSIKAQQGQWFSVHPQKSVMSIYVNPAGLPQPMKKGSYLQIGGIATSYYNDFGYFNDKGFLDLMFHLRQISIPELQYRKDDYNPYTENPKEAKGYEFQFFNVEDEVARLHGRFTVNGPGFIRTLDNGWQWGVIMGFEGEVNVNDFPGVVTFKNYQKYRENNVVSIPEWYMGGLAYSYFGFNGARQWAFNDNLIFNAGLTVKYLAGMAGMNVQQTEQVAQYRFVENEEVVISNIRLNYAYSHNQFGGHGERKVFNGNGLGADLGASLGLALKNKRIKSFQFGASVRNLGFIKMKNEFTSGQLRIVTPVQIDYGAYKEADYFSVLLDSTEIMIGSDQNTLSRSDKGNFSLSPILNLTGAMQLQEYAGLRVFYSLPLSPDSALPIDLAIVPELTFGKFVASFPFSNNQWTGYQLGLGVHYDFISIGTDNLRTLFHRDQLNSGAFYFNVGLALD